MENLNSSQVVADDDLAAIFSDPNDFEVNSNDNFRMNKNTFGFKRFANIPESYEQPSEDFVPEKNDVLSPTDVILHKIFAVDHHGWPNSSISVFLSSKTSDDVRKFIEEKILIDHGSLNTINDPQVTSQFKKLSADFIAEASRNKYESIEAYEKRLNEIIARDDSESIAQRAKQLRDNFFKKLNEMS